MGKKIAILRGINVGGRRKILMKDLKALVEGLGLTEVATYIQSGNVFFHAPPSLTNTAIADLIAASIQANYGFEVPVIVRSSEEIKQAIQNNPFLQQAGVEINQLHLTFLKEAPTTENIAKTNTYNYEPDNFVIQGKEVFVFCKGKYHQSKLSNHFFERKLKVTTTTRNWKTVLKLLDKSIEH